MQIWMDATTLALSWQCDERKLTRGRRGEESDKVRVQIRLPTTLLYSNTERNGKPRKETLDQKLSPKRQPRLTCPAPQLAICSSLAFLAQV